MSVNSKAIAEEVREVLSQALCDEQKCLVHLPEQLPTALYQKVKEVVERLGGKWKGGRTQAHVFPFNPKPLLSAVLDSGVMPPDNPLSFFPTPGEIAEGLLKVAFVSSPIPLNGSYILEPSAGTGEGIADRIRNLLAEQEEKKKRGEWALTDCKLELVEIDPLKCSVLRKKGYTDEQLHEGDFLEWKPDHQFAAILMNPPFGSAMDKKLYLKHLSHAWELLAPEGILVAVVPLSFSFATDNATNEWRERVLRYGSWVDNPAGAFKESGTSVNTCTVWATKSEVSWKNKPYQDCHCFFCWIVERFESCDFESYKRRLRLFHSWDNRLLKKSGGTASEIDAFLPEVTRHFQRVANQIEREAHEGVYLTEECYQYLTKELVEIYTTEPFGVLLEQKPVSHTEQISTEPAIVTAPIATTATSNPENQPSKLALPNNFPNPDPNLPIRTETDVSGNEDHWDNSLSISLQEKTTAPTPKKKKRGKVIATQSTEAQQLSWAF